LKSTLGYRSAIPPKSRSNSCGKWATEDEITNGASQVRKSIRASIPRPSLTPGTILILLAGRFRGKRVILLKNLSQGVLLVTGPFKVNGVPLRRVNARYVIATSQKVDLSGVDSKKVDEVAGDKYFAREKGDKKKGEEQFFKQGEKPEVRKCAPGDQEPTLTIEQKKKPSSSRAADQKAVDKALLSTIKKEPLLISYLASSFSLRKGDRPHEMVW
jgi:large subunit ribosomal protein L6e